MFLVMSLKLLCVMAGRPRFGSVSGRGFDLFN